MTQFHAQMHIITPFLIRRPRRQSTPHPPLNHTPLPLLFPRTLNPNHLVPGTRPHTHTNRPRQSYSKSNFMYFCQLRLSIWSCGSLTDREIGKEVFDGDCCADGVSCGGCGFERWGCGREDESVGLSVCLMTGDDCCMWEVSEGSQNSSQWVKMIWYMSYNGRIMISRESRDFHLN